jgi:hypothetical protein
MAAQEWIYGLTLYFVGIFIAITLFSIAGATSDVSVQGGYNPQQQGGANFTSMPTGVTSTLSIGTYFKDVFSFFVFNISLPTDTLIGQYLWLIRVIFVYLPVLFLVIAVWFSLPTMGGGGG